MKRLVPVLCGCVLLAGCAHERDPYGGGAPGAAVYPYGGLSDCIGYAYGYDPYDPYLDSPGYGGPCTAYNYRYYGYPYSSSQANRRLQITRVVRSNHTRAVGPRAAGNSSPQSSSSSSASSSARAPVTQSSGGNASARTVSPRK